MTRFSLSSKIVCLLTIAVLAPACTKKDSRKLFASLTGGTIAFTSATYSVGEGGGNATITISRTGGSQGAVAVVFSTIVGGSATSPADYTDVIGTIVTWAAGDSANKTVQIPISQDMLVEGDETVELALALSAGGATLGLDRATLTIQDDDAPSEGVLQLSVSSVSVDESAGTVVVTVTRTGGSTGPVSVDFATSDITTTVGSDYTDTNGTLNWAAGDTTPQTITIPITDDGTAEGNETLDLDISNAGGGADLGTLTTTTITIIDDDSTGSLQLALGAFFVSESGVQATITVTRTGGSMGAASVNYATSDNTALAGTDYTAASGTLSWADGDVADKSFVVDITDDALLEGNEDIDLTLSGVSGATLGAPNTGTLTIVDDDSTLEFSPAAFNQVENGITATITVIRNGDTTLPVSVDFATSDGTAAEPGDYAANSGTLNWPAGDGAAKTFDVTLVDDALLEGDETVNLTLSNPAGVGAALGLQNTAILNILDNPGSVQFDLAAYSVGEAGATATITATRTQGSGGVVTVDYGVNGGAPGTAATPADFTLGGTGTLTWPDQDATSQTFTVNIVNDTIVEGDETAGLLLTNPTGGATIGAPAATVLTIVDNDVEVQFAQAAYTMDENGAAITITATRVGTTVGQVTVNWSHTDVTAFEGTDYTSTGGVLTWPDGVATPQTFQVSPIDDFLLEGGETFDLDLTGPAVTLGSQVALGAPATTTVTIVDDDVPGTLQFQTTASSGQEGNVVNVTVTRTAGSGGIVSVDYAVLAGGSAGGGDYTVGGTGTLQWNAGETTPKTFPVTLVADSTSEGSENVLLQLSNEQGGATLGANTLHDLTIVDEAGSLQFISATFNEQEDNTVLVNGVITVSRTGGRGGAVDVGFSVAAGGTATGGGVDFTITNGTLSWPDDVDGNMTFPVAVSADGVIEVLETVNLALAGPTNGAVLGGQATAVLNIQDSPGELNFTMGTFGVQEPNTGTLQALITVSRTIGSGGIVGASLNDVGSGSATSGVDYGAIGGVAAVSFPDGNTTSQSFMVDILSDGTIEVTKDVDLSLVSPTGNVSIGGANTTTLNIQDSPGFISLSSATYSVAETAGSVTITLQRTGGSGGSVSARSDSTNGLATSPADFTAIVNDVQTWNDGDNLNKTFQVTIAPDAVLEGDHEFTLALSNLLGGADPLAPQGATVTITDSPGTLQFQVTSITGDPEGTLVTVNATRTEGSGGLVTATYAFNAGSSTAVPADFIDGGTGTLTWPDGDSTVQSFTLQLVDDTTVDLPIELIAMDLTGTGGGAGLGANTQVTVEIVENDSGVQFTGANFAGTEGGLAFITLSRTGSIANAIAVDFSQTGGVAADPADYSPSPFPTVSWGTNDGNTKTITVTLAADGQAEGLETAVFTLGNPFPSATTTIIGAQNMTTLSITDEPGTIEFTAPDYPVTEGAGPAVIAVTRTGGLGGAVSVVVSTQATGSATDPLDYTSVAQLVSFADGSATPSPLTINIPIADDTTGESVETFALVQGSPTGGVTPGPDSMVTITDDDTSVEFELDFYDVSEPNNVINVTVRRLGTTSGDIDVNWNLDTGTQTAMGPGPATPNDYDTPASATSGTLSWSSGDGTPKFFQVTVVDDLTAEGTEFIPIFLDTPVGFPTLGPRANATVRILDNEETVQFVQGSFIFDEAAGAVTGEVERTGSTAGTLDVDVRDLLSGSATAGVDYIFLPNPQTLSWGAGQGGTRTFSITILNDSQLELGPDETVDLQLENIVGTAALGTPSTATVEITDNNAEIVFSSAIFNTAEGSPSVLITVDRIGATTGSTDVQYGLNSPPGSATNVSDFSFTPAPLTFGVGETTKNFSINIVDDLVAEADPETINLILFGITDSNHSLGPQFTSTVNIAENDVSIVLTSTTFTVDENVGGGMASVTALRVGSNVGQVDVNAETLLTGTATPSPTPNFDFTVTTQGLQWLNGSGGTRTFNFPITDDAFLDPNETVDVRLDPGSIVGAGTLTPPAVGTPGMATVTIIDDDVPGTIQWVIGASNINEAGASIIIQAERVNGSGGNVGAEFNVTAGTASDPADYQILTASPLTWGPGETGVKFLVVQINQDSTAEDPETVELTLSNPSGGAALGAPLVHTLTIDDDDTGFRFTSSSQTNSENVTFVTVDVERIGSLVGFVQVDVADTGTGTADPTPGPTQDYVSWAPLTLFWNDSQGGTMQFGFNVIDDGTSELSDETVILQIQNNLPGSTSLEPPTQHIVTIQDDDGPMVTHSNPFPTANMVDPLVNGWVRFSEPMQIGTVTPTLIRVGGGALPVITEVFWNSPTNTECTIAFDVNGDGFYTPLDLLALGQDYILRINGGATGQTTGLPMGADFDIDFTTKTDILPPVVTAITSLVGGTPTGQDPRTQILTGAVNGFEITVTDPSGINTSWQNAWVSDRNNEWNDQIEAGWPLNQVDDTNGNIAQPDGMIIDWVNVTGTSATLQILFTSTTLAPGTLTNISINQFQDTQFNWFNWDGFGAVTESLEPGPLGGGIPPAISGSAPFNGQTGVSRDTAIFIGLTEPVSPDVVNQVTVTSGTLGNITGSCLFFYDGYSEGVGVERLAGWPNNDTITVQLGTGMVDAALAGGNSPVAPLSISFDTENDPATTPIEVDNEYSPLQFNGGGASTQLNTPTFNWGGDVWFRFQGDPTSRAYADTSVIQLTDITIREDVTNAPYKSYRLEVEDIGELRITNGPGSQIEGDVVYNLVLRNTIMSTRGGALVQATNKFHVIGPPSFYRLDSPFPGPVTWNNNARPTLWGLWPTIFSEGPGGGAFLEIDWSGQNDNTDHNNPNPFNMNWNEDVTLTFTNSPGVPALLPAFFTEPTDQNMSWFNNFYESAGVEFAAPTGLHVLTATISDTEPANTWTMKRRMYLFGTLPTSTITITGGPTPALPRYNWANIDPAAEAIIVEVERDLGGGNFELVHSWIVSRGNLGGPQTSGSFDHPADHPLPPGDYEFFVGVLKTEADNLGEETGFAGAAPVGWNVP